VPGVGENSSPWECQGLLLRISSNQQERKEYSHEDNFSLTQRHDTVDKNAENLSRELEIKLGPTLSTLLRYTTNLEREIARTISLLLKLQNPEG
jgi:hypothetical protein